MKALITGISGFVGSHLAEFLLAHTDWQLAGTVFGPVNNIQHLAPRLELHPTELSDLGIVRGLLEECAPDCVIHLAAQPLVSLSRVDPWGTLQNNIRAQLNILEGIAQLGLKSRVIVIGSSEEYGLVHPDEVPVRETNALRPTSPYAVSKVTQDMLGLQYHLSHGMDVVRVRPFNHIGPRQSPGFVAPDFAQQIARIEAGLAPPVISVGNLEPRRDFSDVRDVVRAYCALLERGRSGEVYNIGSGRAHSIRELLETLLRYSGAPIQVKADPARFRPAEVPVIMADCTQIRRDTGWQAEIPFEQSLQDVLDDWRGRVQGTDRSGDLRQPA